jgi:hypothetical protein
VEVVRQYHNGSDFEYLENGLIRLALLTWHRFW